jgi:hypothetical protein
MKLQRKNDKIKSVKFSDDYCKIQGARCKGHGVIENYVSGCELFGKLL